MPKKFIKRYLPNTETIQRYKSLRFLNNLMHDANLWHLNQYSVATGLSIGLFCAFMPIPFQMVLASILAISFRANLPLSVMLVWVSNPFTMPPMFFFAYKIGILFLGEVNISYNFSFTWQGLLNGLSDVWQPLLLGCLICGISSALFVNIAVRVTWRVWVVAKWRARCRRRMKSNETSN